MTYRLREFVHEQNIREFEAKLSKETDPAKRELLTQLLEAEKEHKLPLPPSRPQA